MLGAARAYQANLTAIGLIRDLVARALELGEGRRDGHRRDSRRASSPATGPTTVGAGRRRPAAPDGGAASATRSASARRARSRQTERQANTAVSGMLDGTADVHDAMIALQRADLTLQFTVQIRNKLVQAYQDIMRMPV